MRILNKTDHFFFRTSASTKERLIKVASANPPKQAIDILTKEQGGELKPHGAASLPCDPLQVKYARQHQQVKDTNLLYSIMLQVNLMNVLKAAITRIHLYANQ